MVQKTPNKQYFHLDMYHKMQDKILKKTFWNLTTVEWRPAKSCTLFGWLNRRTTLAGYDHLRKLG